MQNLFSKPSIVSSKDVDGKNLICGTIEDKSCKGLPKLKFNAGKFKIIQFTDIHWVKGSGYKKYNDSTLVLMRSLIKKEQPDLVIITGDVIVSWGATEEWKEVTLPMVEAKVPFAVTFGNHDTETDLTKLQALEVLKTIPYNITYNAEGGISGAGNCVLPIQSSDGSQNKWLLYLFDSHSYPKNKMFGVYDWIKPDQIEWYRNQRDFYAKENGKVLPSLAFFHIPLPEYDQILRINSAIGTKEEAVCSANINCGLFSSFLEKKDLMGVFVGHDHNNDYLVDANGEISLAFGRKTGYAPAYKEVLERGGRVINLYEDELCFNTYIETLNGILNEYTFEQKNRARSYPIAEGSFIQESLVKNWDDDQWFQELKTLKEAGMKYLIFAPTLLVDKNGRSTYLYPSSYAGKNEKPSKDLLELCLRNAKKCGLKVFVGLNMNDKWWSVDFTPDWLYQQMKNGNKIADELVALYKKKYGDTMYGWYWVWEVDNLHANTEENQFILANALNINLDHLNRLTPDMPFMLSPFVNQKLGTAAENRKIWESVFARTHFKNGDIFSPQDCVGAGGLEIETLPEWFSNIRQAVNTKPGLKFWANVEIFDQRFWTTASLGRFRKQLDAVNPYVNKIITFAYSHYYSPLQVNKQYHNAYMEYCNTGELPKLSAPDPVSESTLKINKNGRAALKWKSPENKTNLLGYYIYKDGNLLVNIPYNESASIIEYVDKNKFQNNLYEISTYNANGNESMKISVQKL
ncbi:hypothetical protein BSYN_00360 [Bacteroides sedimenti]|uniref:DUF4434 domain-containing protein n=1 Tax=Bacteroides sedimenti TaxID=2136147 RepID=A0ABM8IDJ3_9BACE